MDYNQILSDIRSEIAPYVGQGTPATYIPELRKVNPDHYGICLHTLTGECFRWGDADVRFSIQSISKVFSLAMSFSVLGGLLWKRIGVEPSGAAFNSVIQLELERGIPRNPLINSGAIVMTDVLLSELDYPEEEYLEFVRGLCGNPDIRYNESVAVSEREQGFLNAAIANMLRYYGNVENDIERVLRFYFRQCSIEMSCADLSAAFLHFANHIEPFRVGRISLTASQVKRINAIMQTCGFYNEAGEFAFLVGLPAKSGVGGGISAVCPGKYAVTVWSPRLNDKGNSILGMKTLELLTTMTEESIF